MSLLLGIDIGTSGAKAVVYDAGRGAIIASATAEYPLWHPQPGWSEQAPGDWWAGVCGAIRGVLAKGVDAGAIAGVGLSGQMHGSVLMGADAAGSGGGAEALRRALLWNDQRTADECAQIETAVGGRARLVAMSGSAALTGFTLPKLLWVRQHEPEVWARVRHVLLPKDFVRFRLTGELGGDVGDAAGTLLLDVNVRGWSAELCGAVGLDRTLLPPLMESAAVAGIVTAWAAQQTGLRAGTLVVAGSGDNQCGAVGAGIVEPGLVLAILGTSGVVYAHSDQPRPDAPAGRLHAMCAATGDARRAGAWCNTGVMLSAAGALQWARDTIAPGAAFDDLLAEAASAPAGCEGLVFLPYLTGERCPYADPAAKAGWIGLTARHTRGHMIRAVIEGVTFGMGQVLDLVRDVGVPIESVRLSGGGNRSALWRQIQADVFGFPVVSTNSDEGGSALGAAILAGVGAGAWTSVPTACREVIRETEMREPVPAAVEQYLKSRDMYAGLYADLRERFREMG